VGCEKRVHAWSMSLHCATFLGWCDPICSHSFSCESLPVR
jgi:hypothetical protein